MPRTNQIPGLKQYVKPRTRINKDGQLSIKKCEKNRVHDINNVILPVGAIDSWFPSMTDAKSIVQNIADNYDFIDWLILSHEKSGGKLGDQDVVDFLRVALDKVVVYK